MPKLEGETPWPDNEVVDWTTDVSAEDIRRAVGVLIGAAIREAGDGGQVVRIHAEGVTLLIGTRGGIIDYSAALNAYYDGLSALG